MPPDTDRSTQANITRIKCYRNEVITHVTSTSVDNLTFQSLWKKIAQALVELGIPQSDVKNLERCPLGPEEEMYVEKLKEWQLQEDECITRLATIERSVNRLTKDVKETRDEVNQYLRQSQEKQRTLKHTLRIPTLKNNSSRRAMMIYYKGLQSIILRVKLREKRSCFKLELESGC